MRKLALAALMVAGAIGVGGCGGKSDAKHLTIAGSTAFTPVAQKLADAFKAKRPGVTVDIHSVGSMVGIKNVNDGACDVGMADVADLPAEAKSLKAVIISRDGIAVVVNPANSVSDLTLEQVAKIFDGSISNWKDVGGADKAITVICREESSGSRKTFDSIAKVKGKVTKAAQFQNSNGACRAAVASDPNAISYVTMVQVDASVKALSIGGAAAKIESVREGKYTIVATDYLLTKGEPSGLSKEFIEFALSEEGQKLIKEAGLIPVK